MVTGGGLGLPIWGSLSAPWQACLEEAWSAYCSSTFPIGSVLVDGAGNTLARGRNQIRDNPHGAGIVRDHELAHAELNTLLAVKRDRIDSKCALYALLEPCPLCIGAFYMSGVRRLHYAARDPVAGSTNLIGVSPYMKRKPIHLFHAEVAGLETLAIVLNVDFNIEFRGDDADDFIGQWRDALPKSVALGESLARSGQLRALRAAGATTARMVDELATQRACG